MVNTKKQRTYHILIICLFLISSLFFVYSQVLNFDFIGHFDDDLYVTENLNVKAGLTKESIKWAFTTFHSSNWHPITWLSHMTDIELFGINPGNHHIINLFFHIANSLLLFLILLKTTSKIWQSAMVASLFAFHPLNVESVAWIAERKNVLSTFFWLLTTGSYIHYVRHKNIQRYLIVIFFFISGLMSKPMLVTLPFTLILLDYWPLNRFKNVSSQKESPPLNLHQKYAFIFEKIPLILLSILSCIVTYIAQDKSGAVSSTNIFSLYTRFSNAIVSYTRYIGKMILPDSLAAYYPYSDSISYAEITCSSLFLTVLTYLFIKLYKKGFPYLITSWLWYLGTLVPVIGLVQVGNQSMADRYTYVPHIGLFIIISWGIPDFLTKFNFKKTFFIITASLYISFCLICTWIQVSHWKNGITLFTHTLKVAPNNPFAHNNLGVEYFHKKKYDKAIFQFNKALALKPYYKEVYYNLGLVFQQMENSEEALSHFQKSLHINPDYTEALMEPPI